MSGLLLILFKKDQLSSEYGQEVGPVQTNRRGGQTCVGGHSERFWPQEEGRGEAWVRTLIYMINLYYHRDKSDMI